LEKVEEAGAGFGERAVSNSVGEVLFEEEAREREAGKDFAVGGGALAQKALR
jgi:hypothetical protein